MESIAKLYRSWMFVPGHRQRMIDKSFGLVTVDAIMLDIEDGVARHGKPGIRWRDLTHARMHDALCTVRQRGLGEGRLSPSLH